MEGGGGRWACVVLPLRKRGVGGGKRFSHAEGGGGGGGAQQVLGYFFTR